MVSTVRIHSVETCGTVDGPGLRYITFFQGCNLRCKYCHNPDTWSVGGGTEMTVLELLEDVMKYKSYIKFSGGGFTACGGEPLLQAGAIAELFRQLKERGIHTALDTSGSVELSRAKALLDHTDLVILDIKSLQADKYRELTAADINATLKFSEYLSERRIPTWVRHVVVPGLTDSEDSIASLAGYLKNLPNVERAELLPFHKMGEHKWEGMGLPYTLKDTPQPDEGTMSRLNEMLGFKNS